MKQKKRLTRDDFRLGFDNSALLPSYTAIYERLREYEAVDTVQVRCRDCKSANVRDDMGEDFYECPQNGVTVFCNGGHFCGYGEPRTPPAE